MNELRLLTLGVGDAFSRRFYSASLALSAGDRWLLVDCPHPIRKILGEAAVTAGLTLDVDRLDGVVLTHVHADHCSGLEGLAFYFHYVLQRRLQLVAHPKAMERLWDGHLAAGMQRAERGANQPAEVRTFADFFELIPLSEHATTPFGSFSIDCRFTQHSVPTTALRIAAGGRSLGYSSDTMYDPALIEWLSAADLIVHESGSGGMHTPAARLDALPPELRARFRLIHLADDFDPAASSIAPLRQGEYLRI